jgi:hypothetical protein
MCGAEPGHCTQGRSEYESCSSGPGRAGCMLENQEYRLLCPSEPARTTVSCADAVGLADKFARAQSLAPESATVKFIRSFGVSEGHGVPAWIVAFSRPSVPYEVVLSARNGRVIAHTT